MLYHMHDAFINDDGDDDDDDDLEYTVQLQANCPFTRGLLNPYRDSIVGR